MGNGISRQSKGFETWQKQDGRGKGRELVVLEPEGFQVSEGFNLVESFLGCEMFEYVDLNMTI